MTIERRRPLPAGRYWIDIFESGRSVWELWSGVMQKLDRLKILSTESFDAVDGAEPRQFVIFETSGETVGWPEKLGSPTIAGANVQSSADTVQRPDPTPALSDQVAAAASSFAETTKKAVGIGVGVAVVLLGIVLLRK